jgi:hypothetical protein
VIIKRSVSVGSTHTCCPSRIICFKIYKSEKFVNFFKDQDDQYLNTMVVEFFQILEFMNHICYKHHFAH